MSFHSVSLLKDLSEPVIYAPAREREREKSKLCFLDKESCTWEKQILQRYRILIHRFNLLSISISMKTTKLMGYI